MTLLRRTPREVYRVYSETEFFDGTVGVELFTPATALSTRERRLRRLAGAAVLAGAVGTMGGAVVLAGSRPARGSGRGVGNGAAQALARARLVARVQTQLTRSTVAGASDVAIYPSEVRRARSVSRARAHLALTADATSRTRSALRALAERAGHIEQREGHSGDTQVSKAMLPVDTASGSASVPAVSDEAPTTISAAARSSSPSTTAASPPPAISAERAEFGFER
jgi:hypothetical protein